MKYHVKFKGEFRSLDDKISYWVGVKEKLESEIAFKKASLERVKAKLDVMYRIKKECGLK